ncbi:hypothetical protein SDC9_153660 [bioreactor metagenome]|uniref:Uncharacterized protein n=1 Tax=bioreactor metagenome TaxID=1076179 RepID=A0A645F1A4_9ZZZZ
MLFPVVVFHEEHAGVGHVIDVEKLSERGTAAPDFHFAFVLYFGFVKLPYEGWEHVTVLEVEVIFWSIEVGGHAADKVVMVLPFEKLAHF